jgi:hypothetical protein
MWCFSKELNEVRGLRRSQGRNVGRTASAKALRQDRAWRFGGALRRPVWMQKE